MNIQKGLVIFENKIAIYEILKIHVPQNLYVCISQMVMFCSFVLASLISGVDEANEILLTIIHSRRLLLMQCHKPQLSCTVEDYY